MEMTLEFLKVFLSAQVIAGAFALVFILIFKAGIKRLIDRIATIKLPGGSELTTTQIEKSREAMPSNAETTPKLDEPALPQDLTLTPEQQEVWKAWFKAERARAAIWEYNFLNLFLVRTTQDFLDWLSKVEAPLTTELADTMWQPVVPSIDERRAILEALRSQHLVDIQNNLLVVTPKGKEYIKWRGPLPQKAGEAT